MKKSLKIILIIFVILILLILIGPQIIFPQCVLGGGLWKGFSNGCADSCPTQEQLIEDNGIRVCTAMLSAGCDCGPNKCWDGNKCVPNPKIETPKENETQNINNINFSCNKDTDCILRMDEKVSCSICSDCKIRRDFDDPDIIAVNKTFNITCPPRPKEVVCVACVSSIITPDYYPGHVKCINHICVKLI